MKNEKKTQQTLEKCMYFWVPSIACTNLTSLYINYTTNGFVPVVQKMILDVMLPVRTSLLCESFLVESLVYLSSLHPRFVSLFQSGLLYIFSSRHPCLTSLFQSSLLYIFQAYILASRVYFNRVSCLFSSLHPRFASLFQLSLMSIFQAYILALRVYFSRLKQILLASLFQLSRTKPEPKRQRQSHIFPISKLLLVG